MKKVTQSAAGVVLFRESDGVRRYLLVRSALTRKPLWEFPKGGVEAGETEAEAAERELQEEAGLEAGDYRVLPGFLEEESYVFTRGGGVSRILVVKRVVYLLAEARSDKVHLSPESDEFRWADYDEAVRLLRFPGKKKVLDRAEEFLEKRSPES